MFRLLVRDHHVVGRFDVEHRHQVRAAILALAEVEIDAAGIAAMPLPDGIGSRLKSRIELPASLPLAIRLFLAMLVEIEDPDRFRTSWS